MSTYYNPGPCAIVQPDCNNCIVKERGRVRALFIMTSAYYNTNPNWMLYSTYTTAVENGEGWFFPFCQGTADHSEKVSDDYGSTLETVDAYTIQLKCQLPAIQTDIPFWISAKNNRGLYVAYFTETMIWVGENPAMIVPSAPVTNVLLDKIDIKVGIKWVQDDMPEGIITGINNQLVNICIDPE